MTAGVLDFAGVGNWRWRSTTNGTQQRQSYIERTASEQLVATLGHEHSYAMRTEVLARLLELASKAPQVQPSALVRVWEWLPNLPEALPNPFLAIGEDGSISTEWDADGSSLHITFDEETEEVYFLSPNGDEWESTLDAVDKVSSAMRTIALAASAQR
jgi:hypothetical protein